MKRTRKVKRQNNSSKHKRGFKGGKRMYSKGEINDFWKTFEKKKDKIEELEKIRDETFDQIKNLDQMNREIMDLENQLKDTSVKWFGKRKDTQTVYKSLIGIIKKNKDLFQNNKEDSIQMYDHLDNKPKYEGAVVKQQVDMFLSNVNIKKEDLREKIDKISHSLEKLETRELIHSHIYIKKVGTALGIYVQMKDNFINIFDKNKETIRIKSESLSTEPMYIDVTEPFVDDPNPT